MAKIVKHDDGSTAVVYVRVPGWLKNQIAREAKRKHRSINQWASNILMQAILEGKGLPDPVPPPTPEEIVEGYVTKTPPLEPCGVPAPCKRTGEVEVDGFSYCDPCGIRLA
jgi:hypothetical protein